MSNRLLHEAMSLPPEERLELAQELFASIETKQLPDEVLQMVKQRFDDADQHDAWIDGPTAFAQIRAARRTQHEV